MLELYTFRIDIFEVEPIDLTGFHVEAMDGSIGTIDEATMEAGSSCLVVDTGFWIFGKKRMIPAGVIDKVDVDARKVYVAMSKDAIRDAPDFDEEHHRADAEAHRAEQANYWSRLQR